MARATSHLYARRRVNRIRFACLRALVQRRLCVRLRRSISEYTGPSGSNILRNDTEFRTAALDERAETFETFDTFIVRSLLL